MSAITYREFICLEGIVPSSLDSMELATGSVVISRNGVLMRSETQAHPYQGWTTIVVLQVVSCKGPVVQSIFCLTIRLEESYIFPSSSKFGTLIF